VFDDVAITVHQSLNVGAPGRGGGRGAVSLAPTSRREAGQGGPRSAAEAHARRAGGGGRLPGAAAEGRNEPLDLLDDSAMRRHMLKDHRGRQNDDEDTGKAWHILSSFATS